ncbi:MAG TPA: SGNH/GDSL hydrolase family protein [Opitutaceae bacterium]|nr:SGNH/GDSL hydrolase family protein [Opitutaceae bacterium]
MNRKLFLRTLPVLAGWVAALLRPGSLPAAEAPCWIPTWATAVQLVEPNNLPPAPGFAGVTLRQRFRISIGGRAVRVRFSNQYGRTPLTIDGAEIARAATADGIEPGSSRPVLFLGRRQVMIEPGAFVVSDPVDFPVDEMADLAVTLGLREAPGEVTGHPGSRTTSYFAYGATVDAPALPEAKKVDRWYFLSGVDVAALPGAAAVAVLGDSITDGRGSTTNGNDRWPDILSRRLRANPATAQVAVLNQGIGGGRVLRDGLGPSALSRLDRDVIAQPGVRWLIILEGVNDLGGAVGARQRGEPHATADDLIAAYEQIIRRAHDHGIKVYGATIMPFEGFSAYHTPESEAERRKVNDWIRTSGRFDAVIDFDAVARDPANPGRLSAATDGGDHLHLSAAGYRIIGESIDLKLFEP